MNFDMNLSAASFVRKDDFEKILSMVKSGEEMHTLLKLLMLIK